jgi:hypothetical protein
MLIDEKPAKKEKYIDNKEFTRAMTEYFNRPESVEYRTLLAQARKDKTELPAPPPITPYIGECILKIAKGLANKPNFYSYTWKDDMISDAIENCCKVVSSFNPNAVTRAGKPNAFGYFTQICYFAFLRRIQKEGRQQEIKDAFIDQAGLSDLASVDSDFPSNGNVTLENTKNRRDPKEKTRKYVRQVEEVEPSGVEAFMD